jgi:hypothetical protein
MIILRANYETTDAYLAALDNYFTGEGEVYINRVKYDLSRDCDRAEYLVHILKYQLTAGFADTAGYPGYGEYTEPGPIFNISYVNGYATKVVNDPPITYTPNETTLTIEIGPLNNTISLINTDITLNFGGVEYTVTADENGVATFDIFVTDEFSGDIIVTSTLADAASNGIALAYHGEAVDTTTQLLDAGANYAGTLVPVQGGFYAVGDVNADGGFNQSPDMLSALTLYNNDSARLKATKFLTLTSNSSYYFIQGGALEYTITPTNQSYTYGNNYLGQPKPLSRLHMTIIVHDSDGNPGIETSNGHVDLQLTANDLEANGSYIGTIPISAQFDNPVLLVLALVHAYNKAVITSSSTLGLTTAISAGDKFEPGDTISITFAADTSGAKVLGSLLYARGYSNEQLTGTPIVQVDIPLENYNTVHNIAVPTNVDRDLFFKIGYTVFNVTNRITYGVSADADLNYNQVLESYSVNCANFPYYPEQDTPIAVFLDFYNNLTRSDYSVSIYAIDPSGTVYTVALEDTVETQWAFAANSGNLTGQTNIEIKIILSLV